MGRTGTFLKIDLCKVMAIKLLVDLVFLATFQR